MAEPQAHDYVLPSMVKWKRSDLETSERSVLRSTAKQSWRYQKDNTVDPKSWLERAIPDDKGGRNTAEGKEQVICQELIEVTGIQWLPWVTN